MSCWAACLKFWYKAALSISKSQKKLIGKYNHLSDAWGAMGSDAIIEIISDTPMYVESYMPATKFTNDVLLESLQRGPVYVAYTETSTQRRHVNVIHGVVGSGNTTWVYAMEPQFSTDPNTFESKGAHVLKPFSDFNRLGDVYLGVG